MNKQFKNKSFLSFILYFKYIFYSNIFFVFFFLRKKKYWSNFGLFLPNNQNNIQNFSILNNTSFIKSYNGVFFFKYFFRFFFGIQFFSSYFISLFRNFMKSFRFYFKGFYKKKMKFKINKNLYIRFLSFQEFTSKIVDFQKIFNKIICIRINKNNYKKINF